MKKLSLVVSILLLLSLALGMSSCAFFRLADLMIRKGADDVVLEFSLNKDENAYIVSGSNISEKSWMDNWEQVDVVIPAEYEGLPVTEIGYDAFKGSHVLRSIVIPESVEVIGLEAFFDCTFLESITIPKSVTTIRNRAFKKCTALKAMYVDPQNKHYCSVDGNLYTKSKESLVFYAPGQELDEFAIPEDVYYVCVDAFSFCKNLKHISISKSVCEFPHDAISNCEGMQGVSVDENNKTYRSIDGNLYTKDGKTFLKLCVSVENTTVVIPEGVTSIAKSAMSYGKKLTSVTLPLTLKSIGESAFYRCENLTSIIIPGGVDQIERAAFSGCENLSEVFFENPLGWKAVPNRGKFQTTKYPDPIKLTSPKTAAEYLVEEYDLYDWQRAD